MYNKLNSTVNVSRSQGSSARLGEWLDLRFEIHMPYICTLNGTPVPFLVKIDWCKLSVPSSIMPECSQRASSLCWEGSKPAGATYSLNSSNTKRHQGGSYAPKLTDLHVTFAVHSMASNGLGGIIIIIRN